MISNNQNTQDYYNLPIDQIGNNNENIQHTLINNVGVSNTNLNTLHSVPHNNNKFEFYFYLPNDTRIYRVTYSYSELNPSENVQLLNNGINLSHIPDYLFPHHYNVQSRIQQQIQQQVQHSNIYQQNDIQQQSFDTTQPTSQEYSNNDIYNAAVDGTVSYDMQDMEVTGFQNSPKD
ncbi:unnamed protein product [Rhizophagus irregularis]|nr:unnamed protein product [Rhizophagus irregularis]